VSSAPLAATTKPDYGWLAELMAKWVGNLEKRYPVSLRTEGIQGKVTLIAVLHDDGRLSDIRVTRSSGNEELDRVAVEDVTKGAPIVLSRPLERPQMPVKLSLVYDLRSAR
jgi:TonB family protein